MNQMLADLWQRLTKEANITLVGTREAVLCLSERVNRKTQLLRLHWQAAALTREMEKVSRNVGHALCDLTPFSSHDTGIGTANMVASTHLFQGAASVRSLKQELTAVEKSIRELEVEVLHEDLVKIQRDLMSRSAGLSRLVVAPGSPAVGLPLIQLTVPEMTRAVALFRGPTLLSPTAEVPIRAGDIVVFLGPQAELQQVASHFVVHSHAEARNAKAK
jgi:K+/H+ antiporter YhaU regulatory subunit KhtT